MTTTKELNIARKNLVASLGELSKEYFEKMKLWFQMKTSREKFDCDVRKMMTREQVHLHNEFLLCLFNKVQGLASSAPLRPVKLSNNVNNSNAEKPKSFKEKRLGLKRQYKSDKSIYESVDMYVKVLGHTSSAVGDEPIGASRSSAQELVLPDRTFVLARLMLAAWENNMDGAEENTAQIIIAATQVFLKNILTAMFTRRKGFTAKSNTFIHNIGEPVPSSWKRNTAYIYDEINSRSNVEIVNPEGQIPGMRRNVEEAEQATAFAIACATQTDFSPSNPVGIVELMRTLKMYKNLVSNHTIYATNMERLYTYSTHPTWEDAEARDLLCVVDK